MALVIELSTLRYRAATTRCRFFRSVTYNIIYGISMVSSGEKISKVISLWTAVPLARTQCIYIID